MLLCLSAFVSLTRQIAHNTLYQIIGKAVSTLLGLLAIGMMTRYLGTEQFGWYITVITFLQFVGILTDFGLVPVTSQMMSEPTHDKKELFKNLLGFRFVTAVVFLGIAPLIALFFPYPYEVKIAIGFSTISFLGVAMNQVLIGFYQTKLKMYIPAIAEVVGRIALVAGLWFLIMKKYPFLPIMGVVVMGSVIYTLILWLRAHKLSPATFAYNKEIWLSIMRKMWPIAISIIFNVIYLKGDIFLLTFFRDQTEVGIYGAAYRVIDILAQLAMMIMGVMLPLMAYSWSRGLKEEFRHKFQLSFDVMMMIAIPITFGTIALAGEIMHIVGGNEFIVSGKALQILAIALFGVFLGAVFGHTAVAIDRQKQTMWIYISDAILTLTGYLIFIPRYGMYGAAWMTVFSELYAGILLLAVTLYYVREKIVVRTFLKIVLAGIIMAAALPLMQHLHIVIRACLSVGIYGTLLILTKAVSRETLKEILSIRR